MDPGEDSTQLLRDWAASGAMALTGYADGPPLAPPGRAATLVADALRRLGRPATEVHPFAVRAAYLGLSRRGPWSCGGAFRTLRAADGWAGLSLARPDDRELVSALVQADVVDPWEAVKVWARRTAAADLDARFELLGLPGGGIPTPAPVRRGVEATALGRRAPTGAPQVVDLTSMWAGPLCARLLGLAGARVTKVESAGRPDGARSGPPGFFAHLHEGHASLTLDFATETDQLRALLRSADVVLESSRPRALQQLGVDAEELVAAGVTWVSITARGRTSGAVGFGDDVAASAGLVVTADDHLLPAGDALADPLTGVIAAEAVLLALAGDEAQLLDVSMLDVARETLAGWAGHPEHLVVRRGGGWWVETEQEAFAVVTPGTRP